MNHPSFSNKPTFPLVLNTLYKGNVLILEEARCMFSYQWDNQTHTGQAQLLSINDSLLAISLYYENGTGKVSFVSDSKPTPYTIKGVSVVIKKVYLQIDPVSGAFMAAVAFNSDGGVIQATANFQT